MPNPVTLATLMSLASILAVATVSLSRSDLLYQRIPNRPLVLFVLLSVVVVSTHALLVGNPESAARATLLALTVTPVACACALLAPGKLGGGDVKLLGYLVFVLSWFGWLTLGLAAIAWLPVTVLWSRIRAALRGPEQIIPLAPGLFLTTWLALLVSSVASASLSGATA